MLQSELWRIATCVSWLLGMLSNADLVEMNLWVLPSTGAVPTDSRERACAEPANAVITATSVSTMVMVLGSN